MSWLSARVSKYVSKKNLQWRRNLRRGKKNVRDFVQNLLKWINIPWIFIAIILLSILYILGRFYDTASEIHQGVYIEAWGTLFDIVIVGVVLWIFGQRRARRDHIERLLEEIDDFKKWDSEEARLRIAGNVRRLIKLGKTNIDFSGIVLRNFSFQSHDIERLNDSTFSIGMRLDTLSKNSTNLENVDFSFVDCRNVKFSKAFGGFAVGGLVGENLSFVEANLNNACFEGAKLSWNNYKEDKADWFIDHGFDDEGRPMTEQAHYPAFSGADLKGCSFRYAELDRADFREAVNVLEADFGGAKGIETCFFDETSRTKILDAAKKKPNIIN